MVFITYSEILCYLNVCVMNVYDDGAGGVVVVVDRHGPLAPNHVCHEEVLAPPLVLKVPLVKGDEVLLSNHVPSSCGVTDYPFPHLIKYQTIKNMNHENFQAL